MAVTINQELLTFYDKLSSAIGTIGSNVSNLSTKLNNLKSTNTSAKSEISTNYSGAGQPTVVNAFSSLNSTIDSVVSSLSEGPLKVISESNDLISKITVLKTKKETIDGLEERKRSLGGLWEYTEDRTKEEVYNYNKEVERVNTEITNETKKFNEKHEEAERKLTEIKSINPTIEVAKVDTTVPEVHEELLQQISGLQPGTYKELSYIGSNGTKINYSIYVPASASTTVGLPVHLYMSGSRATGHGGGLSKLLYEGQQSNGIVIAVDTDNDGSRGDPGFMSATKELTDKVVQTYKADTRRISTSGHSMGGRACINMAAKYPGYFSIVAPVCGFDQSGRPEQEYVNLANTRILGYLGEGDQKSTGSMEGLYNKIGNRGNMELITIPGGHRIQDKVYGEQVIISGKRYENLLEYCLAQTK